jgi:hypothetical protein
MTMSMFTSILNNSLNDAVHEDGDHSRYAYARATT